MTAYDWYMKESVRRAGDCRQYYLTMRQTLLEEARKPGEKPLLAHLAGLPVEEGMYLLDAAAVWECFEQTSGMRRGFRDVGRGFPFPLDGRILSWNEVQRRAEAGQLPAALQNGTFRQRLTALCHGVRPGHPDFPPVDSRALLLTESLPVMTASGGMADVAREAEIAALREELRLLRQVQHHEEEHALQAAEHLLAGKTEEVQQQAATLHVRLQEALAELAGVAAEVRVKQKYLAAALDDLKSARVELTDLTRQAEEAAAEAASLRERCTQARQAAQRVEEERRETERALAETEAERAANAARLRQVRCRAEDAWEAEDPPQSLSDYL